MLNNRFGVLLGAFLITACVGAVVVSAQNKETSLEELTSKSAQEVQMHPIESARAITTEYFTAIMNNGDADGIPLIHFRITNINLSDSNNIKVTVALTYDNKLGEMPVVDYSIVHEKNRYHIQKQYCAFNSDKNSVKYGTVRCSSTATPGKNGSISF